MKGVYAAVCERPQARAVSNQRATWKLYICIYILALRLLTVCLRINWGHEPMTGQSNKALLSTERHCTVILITLFQRCIAFVNHTAIDYLHISPSLLSLSETQVLSGDSIIVRGPPRNGPPPEKQINFSNVLAPRLARRPTGNSDSQEVLDEPWAWEAREFLRKKLIGVEVYFSADKPANSTRYYGTVYLGPDASTAVNVTELLVAEGFASVRRENSKAPEVAKLAALEDQAKASGKGKWGGTPSEHVRNVKWTQENPRAIIEQKNGKSLKAIIEHVRDGSTVRAFLLPDFYYVTIMISGIRCPGLKLDADGRPDPSVEVPYAEEARFFVESNFLQRDVEVRNFPFIFHL